MVSAHTGTGTDTDTDPHVSLSAFLPLSPVTEWEQTQFEAQPGTYTTDRTCDDLTKCTAGEGPVRPR